MKNGKLKWMISSQARKGEYVVFRDTYLGICRDDHVDRDMRLCEVYSEIHTTEYVPSDYLEKLHVTPERFQSMLGALRDQIHARWGRYPDWPKKYIRIH